MMLPCGAFSVKTLPTFHDTQSLSRLLGGGRALRTVGVELETAVALTSDEGEYVVVVPFVHVTEAEGTPVLVPAKVVGARNQIVIWRTRTALYIPVTAELAALVKACKLHKLAAVISVFTPSVLKRQTCRSATLA